MDSFNSLYYQRAVFLVKLLDAYLDKRNAAAQPRCCDLSEVNMLPLLLRKEFQKPMADFLRTSLQCKVTFGKDRYGQPNGYLMISLDNEHLNQTKFYSASLALQKFRVTSSA
ncbi:MAG: hypothetical protein CK424_02695 [Legionella sp.]|nr:MAG: hypothetical protein CK424_02695 [Legionella sp.]